MPAVLAAGNGRSGSMRKHGSQSTPGTLYIVSTPIGNLQDVTLRALEVLASVDLIASEDTRQTRKLLERHHIKRPLISYHEHNEARRTPELIARLLEGRSIALVTDAGTPLISDPGLRLVRACQEHGIQVVPVPGPSAVLAALVASGLETKEFLFVGFLPARAAERNQKLRALLQEPRTTVFFEAPHRIAATLRELATLAPERKAVVARELTKVHEEFLRGTVAELATLLTTHEMRGEFTVVLAGATPQEQERSRTPQVAISLAERIAELVSQQGLDWKQALKQAARERGLSRREAYRLFLKEKQRTSETPET